MFEENKFDSSAKRVSRTFSSSLFDLSAVSNIPSKLLISLAIKWLKAFFRNAQTVSIFFFFGKSLPNNQSNFALKHKNASNQTSLEFFECFPINKIQSSVENPRLEKFNHVEIGSRWFRLLRSTQKQTRALKVLAKLDFFMSSRPNELRGLMKCKRSIVEWYSRKR